MRRFKVKATEHVVGDKRLWNLYTKEDGWFKDWEYQCGYWAPHIEAAMDEARIILQEAEGTI